MASLLGDDLDKRRRAAVHAANWTRDRPGKRRVLAVHVMINIAITGAAYDIDGGPQFIA